MLHSVRCKHLLAVLPVGSVTDPVSYHEEPAPVKGENDFTKGIYKPRCKISSLVSLSQGVTTGMKYHTPSAKISVETHKISKFHKPGNVVT